MPLHYLSGLVEEFKVSSVSAGNTRITPERNAVIWSFQSSILGLGGQSGCFSLSGDLKIGKRLGGFELVPFYTPSSICRHYGYSNVSPGSPEEEFILNRYPMSQLQDSRNFIAVELKIYGANLSGCLVEPKLVRIFPSLAGNEKHLTAVKSEFQTGLFIVWNKCQK